MLRCILLMLAFLVCPVVSVQATSPVISDEVISAVIPDESTSSVIPDESTSSVIPDPIGDPDEVDVGEILFGHVGDSYGWHLTQWNGRHISIPLPCIVRSSKGCITLS